MSINFPKPAAGVIRAASLAGALLTAGCGSEKAEPVTIEPPVLAAEAATNSAMKAKAAEKGRAPAAPQGFSTLGDD